MSMTTPSTPPTNNRKASPLVVTGVIAVLAMIGIYASNDDDAPASSTPTATYAPPTAQVEPDAATGAGEPAAAAPAGAPAAVVPDVVGMNHQVAQDTLQAAGFYLLREEDATGQGRMLILDRNWQVVSQSAEAGTSRPTDTWIALSSKKVGE